MSAQNPAPFNDDNKLLKVSLEVGTHVTVQNRHMHSQDLKHFQKTQNDQMTL
jgi:hypothetical protein